MCIADATYPFGIWVLVEPSEHIFTHHVQHTRVLSSWTFIPGRTTTSTPLEYPNSAHLPAPWPTTKCVRWEGAPRPFCRMSETVGGGLCRCLERVWHYNCEPDVQQWQLLACKTSRMAEGISKEQKGDGAIALACWEEMMSLLGPRLCCP